MSKAVAAEQDKKKKKAVKKEYEARIASFIAETKKEEKPEENPETEPEPLVWKMKEVVVPKSELKRQAKAQKRKEDHALLIEQNRSTDLSGKELESMKRLLDKDHLIIHQIASDGNCLYRALEHQLLLAQKKHGSDLQALSFRDLRKKAAEQFRSCPENYSLFLFEEYEGFQHEYLDKLENSDEWGGELEIKLLADALNVVIAVYTSDEKIEYTPSPVEDSTHVLRISFHRHLMASSHYNSLVRQNDGSASHSS
eukprot:Protomagalhaensia_sp_Gyna_25__5420@NODE_703_length_2809_cov_26_090975_g522_i1_p1_GENE_NODE_703_length_2809_cov_26_090975_g522_i1NODE_703_length_2809_cov_26_090975_g522_i1_p1_ORF_typecomplete_len254_score57_78OTU/PF02338_19/4_8e03OTU/PF02338_19/2_6e22Peptidase_C65/PF10275_9/0_0083Peptidase_C65/PF10275_9/0_0085PdaC/PF13739_6/0_16PdaC/PF13739_6/3_5e03OmpH/PF03938_14/0_8_NODE_703_length_2809_cov_26_090975_g522_i119372698